jgi:prepilin-type N-terminal cleavage/methylation domain-containing protein
LNRPLNRRSKHGFTLVELMIVVAVIGIAAAITLPTFTTIRTNARAKTTARMMSNAFQRARAEAILTERTHVVMWTAVAATDACGTALPSPIVILDDSVTQNCCIDAGETVVSVSTNPADEFAGLNWGVTFAGVAVTEDGGGGVFTTGSSFTDQFGVQTHWVGFRDDGVPVGFTAACVPGQVGTGGGGVYLTNGGTGGERDYAVVLSALGAPKVYSWNAAANSWTN